jgi:hypothetical protein
MLKKGDRVVMHSCLEADIHSGRVFTCRADESQLPSGERVVWLEGLCACYSVEFLKKEAE